MTSFERPCSWNTWGIFAHCGKMFSDFKLWCHRQKLLSSITSYPVHEGRWAWTALTANRHGGAAVSLVNSFQLQEWISPNWISLCLSRQPIVTKRVVAVRCPLPRKHCQSQVNAFLVTLVPKSCQGNTCSPVSLSCESQWAQQPKAPCW